MIYLDKLMDAINDIDGTFITENKHSFANKMQYNRQCAKQTCAQSHASCCIFFFCLFVRFFAVVVLLFCSLNRFNKLFTFQNTHQFVQHLINGEHFKGKIK